MREFVRPLRIDQSGLGDRVDVERVVGRQHVGVEAVDHGTRLLARSSVRLLQRRCRAGLVFPLPGERSEEHTSVPQTLMPISYAALGLKKHNKSQIPYIMRIFYAVLLSQHNQQTQN